MHLVNKTTLSYRLIICLILCTLFINITSSAQDNSPYSRYGLGDAANSTNVLNRGMGGVSIAFNSDRFLNTSNPASYAFLPGSNRKLVTFEIGTEYNGRSLIQTNPVGKYKANNLVFNYMQFGMQLSKKSNWGLAFGLQPVARENYKIANIGRISGIDSAFTTYEGSGGAYKGFIGTGYKYKNWSFGINTGYLFGKKNTSTIVTFLNDSVLYYEGIVNNKVNYGNVFLQTGIQYNYTLRKTETTGESIRFGATYELQNRLKASRDVEKITRDYDYTTNPAYVEDSIFVQKDEKGSIVLPHNYGIGFTYQKDNIKGNKSFLVGIDYVGSTWNNYRFFGQKDQVQNSWMIKSGVQISPYFVDEQKRYWSNVQYRAGFNVGRDHISAGGNLPVYAFTLGLGLPIVKADKYRPTQYVQLALEAGKRGNNNNLLRENFVKVALSVSLADVWFFRRKYD